MPNFCIPESQIEQLLRKVDMKTINESQDKEARINIFDITADMVREVITSGKTTAIDDKLISRPVRQKLNDALKIDPVMDKKVKAFIQNLSVQHAVETSDNPNVNKAVADRTLRQGGTALKEIMDSIAGEINKAANNGLKVTEVSNKGHLPNLPLHRVAASIGRKIMYTQGLRFKKAGGEQDQNLSAWVETMYYATGMSAIENLEKNGFLTIHEAGTGKMVIKDYLDSIDSEQKFGPEDKVTDSIPSLELNLEAFGVETTAAKPAKEMAFFTDFGADVRGTELGAYDQVLRAIGLLSQPATFTMPNIGEDGPATESDRHNNDVYDPGEVINKARKEIGENPTFLQGSIHSFFQQLHEHLKDEDMSAAQWLSGIEDKTKLQNLFGLEPYSDALAGQASAAGRKLSKSTPLNDVIEYYDRLKGDSPVPIYMNMFAGRNARLYYDNSILNPHSSKLIRHAMAVDPYTVKVDSDAFKFMVGKVAILLGMEEDTGAVMGNGKVTEQSKKVDRALEAYMKFSSAGSLNKKLVQLTKMSEEFPKLDFSELVSTLGAVQDIQEGLLSGEVTSTYMVSTDATASGGQLTFMQAIGADTNNEEDYVELMKQLGLFKGEKEGSLEGVEDVYGILKRRLEFFTENKQDPDAQSVADTPKTAAIRSTVKKIQKVLFENDIRNMSKIPTMTFIYQQTKGGARSSMSKDFADMIIKQLRNPVISKDFNELIDLVNEILGHDEKYTTHQSSYKKLLKNRDLDLELRTKIAASGTPDFLYDTLTSSLTNKYLKKYQNRAKRIFELVDSEDALKNIRVMPASYVLSNPLKEGESYTLEQYEKYGLTMGKQFEVLNNVAGVDVLTRPDKNRDTVMGVSYIHGADTSNLYRSTEGLPTKHKTGLIVVHDAVYSSPELVMEFEKNYVEENRQLALNYDIHEQVLKSVAAYGGNTLTSKANYTNLVAEVEASKARKQQLLKDSENGYNTETTSVIGDRIDFEGIDTKSPSRKTSTGTQTSTQGKGQAKSGKRTAQNGKPKTKAFSKQSALEIMESLSEDSTLIQKFLSANPSGVKKGDTPQYSTKTDVITIAGVDPRTGKKATKKKLVELVEHEVVHSLTSGIVSDWVSNKKSSVSANMNLAYIDKAVKRLSRLRDHGELKLPKAAAERVNYVLNSLEDDIRISEFIAIMSTEPETAKAVYKVLGNDRGNLDKIIEKVVAKVREILATITEKDFETYKVDSEKLYSAVNQVIQDGQSSREGDINAHRALMSLSSNTELFAADPNNILKEARGAVNYINAAVVRNINDPAVRKAGDLTKAMDSYLKVNSPMYRRALQRLKGIYDDSEALQSLVHKITNADINSEKKNEVQSLFVALRATKNEVISKELEKFSAITSKMSDEEKEAFFDFTHKMAMQDYFLFAEEVTDIDAEIAEIEEMHFDKQQVESLESIVSMNVDDEVTMRTHYNVDSVGFSGELKNHARKLVVLKSIKKLGEDRFNSMKENTELMELIRDNTLAHEALIAEGSLQNSMVRDHKLKDTYAEPITAIAITMEDADKFSYTEKSGWTMVVKPTKDRLGVVYRKEIDGTYQEGMFTDIRTESGDITVKAKHRDMPGVVKVGDRYKLIISQKDKEKMGLVKDASQSLVRSMAHTMTIKESEGIRNKLLEKDTYWDMNEKNMEDLRTIIMDPKRDHPWFLGAKEGVIYDDLPAKVKARYMPIASTKLSDSANFDQKIQYVRKDISYWLVGAKEESLAKDPKLKWALRITKDLIAGAKIGMVVTNPAKILADNMSNVAYLGVMGVDPLTIQKNYREISKQYNDYQKAKNILNNLRVKAYANPKKYGNQIKQMERKLKEMPANGFVERGFVSSMGSELVMQTNDPSSGFKSDIDTVLKTVLQDKSGKHNKVAKFLMDFSKYGNVGMEDFLETWAKPFGKLDSTQVIESELERMAERLRHIKSEDDVVSYMHQYLNSPDSEFVKLGSHMTDLTDILAKETYYRYLVEEGMDAKKAELEVIDSFPDYKEGLPTRVKQLSDVGILMFPTYWLRVQKAIYRMAKNKPVSFGTEMVIEEMAEIEAPTIWDANIWNKATTFHGLFHTPWQNIGVNSLIPKYIY